MTAMATRLNDTPILLIEDSPEDALLTIRAFRRGDIDNRIDVCETADRAFDYLQRGGEFGGLQAEPLPCMIVLDLNLPGMDGRDFLKLVKSDDGLRPIPIVVLTTSDDPTDIETCYRNGANSYITKPSRPDEVQQAVQTLKTYWFDISRLPAAHR